MEPVAISWLVASACSPLIAVLALWTVYVFHTYRKRWRTVDLFLLAVASQELVSALFTFSYAIISLINPPITPLCSFVQWGLISVRTFQISTLTSMVVDRALTVRWPYRYRFSVRRNQIRYHVAVLALMSILVGVASVFAHSPDPGDGLLCSVHPSDWDFKFVVFVLGFYGILVLVSLVCTVQIEVHKCRNGGKHQSKGMPYQLPDCSSSELPVTTTAAAAVTSPLDTESHTGSTKTLHRPYRHSSRRPYGKKAGGASSDFRWPPVAVVSLVCFSVNHLPYLVLTALATAMPSLWSSWHEAMLSWMRLGEGVLIPLVLCIVDQPVRAALKRTFQRRSGALSPLVGDDGPLQMYFDKDHFRKRGAFGSVTPIGIITNYRRTPGGGGGKKRKNKKCKYKLPGLHNGDSIIEKSCLSNNFLSAEPLSKLSCADLTSLEVWQEEDEENFYASLSDDMMSNFSCNSTDDNLMNGDESKMMCGGDDDVYGGSFTTIANDDFEFHDTRPCGGEVRMRPSLTVDLPPNNSFRSSIKSKIASQDKNKIQEDNRIVSQDIETNLMNVTFQSEEEKKDPSFFQTMEKKSNDDDDENAPVHIDVDASKEEGHTSSSLAKTKNSWFSMNDLDLIDKTAEEPQERVFVLPVKSESTLSLYRLRLDKDIGELLPVTKSENNVNDDSGFGSATQTINPIWPGHLLHRPSSSDPKSHHNVNKVIPSGIVSKKNYPCILHPRMQKLPWISAWKKLGGGCNSKPDQDHHLNEEVAGSGGGGVLLINDNFQLRQKETFQWKDSDIYCGDVASREREDSVETSDDIANQQQESFALNNNKESIIYQPSDAVVPRNKKDKAEKKRKSRKNSFKAVVESHSGSRSHLRSHHDPLQDHSDNALCNSVPDNQEDYDLEENIYEEIVSRKSFDDPGQNGTRDSERVHSPLEKSYAQTDILKIAVSNGEYPPQCRPYDIFDRQVKDFSFNINVGVDGGEKCRNAPPPLPPASGKMRPSVTAPHWDVIRQDQVGRFQQPLPGRPGNNERRMVFNGEDSNLPPLPSYNDVNVTYCVNNNLLEFVDTSSDLSHNMRMMIDAQRGREYFGGDLNGNNRGLDDCCFRLADDCQQKRSSLQRRESSESRPKDAVIRRRESNKRDRSCTRVVAASEQMPNERSDGGPYHHHHPVVRRQSDSKIKNREVVKRRKSSCRDSGTAAVIRRESDRRERTPRYDEGYIDGVDVKREVAKIQNKECGLWRKDVDYPKSDDFWNNRYLGNQIRVEGIRCTGDPRTNGYSRVGNIDANRSSKNVFSSSNNNNDEVSTEKLNSNDLIRMKCGYVPPPMANVIVMPPDVMNAGKDVNRIHVRNSPGVFPSELEEHWNRRRRSELADICRRESQKEEPRKSKPRTYDPADHLSDRANRVRRKTSSGRERRSNSDLEGKAADAHRIRRGVRRQESLNDELKRRRDDSDACVRRLAASGDVNRNESSAKPKLETSSPDDSSNRMILTTMDNAVVHGSRRDNGNFETDDTEIFPFETFVKPPPYNLVRYHITERPAPATPDNKDRCKQKQIAITDYL